MFVQWEEESGMGLQPDYSMASPILGAVQPQQTAIKHVTSASCRKLRPEHQVAFLSKAVI